MLKGYLKIIRPLNLLIIALTMFAMRYLVIKPFYDYSNLVLQLTDFDFVLLVVTTILIAAGGYVINDYHDIQSDLINRPCHKTVIGNTLEPKQAMIYYIVLTVLGFASAIWFGIRLQNFNFATLFMLIAGLLWFYSTTYKAMPLVGNLFVAIMTGLVPLLVVLFEMIKFKETYSASLQKGEINFMPIFYFVLFFAGYAFFTNFIREIVKDIIDIEGDKKVEKKTFPVWAGINVSKYMILVLLIVEIVSLYYLYFTFLQDDYSLYYLLFAITPWFVASIIKTVLAKHTKDYRLISTLLKIAMVAGLGYSFIIYIQI